MLDKQTFMEDKPARLKSVRTQLGLSQLEFAEKMGTYQGQIAKMESGKRAIGSNIEFRLLMTFGINQEWWESGHGPTFVETDTTAKMNIPESNATSLPLPHPGDEHELELIKREDSTEFRHLGDDQYLVICPLVEHYAYAGYASGWSDPVYVDELPRHTVVMKNLTLGVYRAFVVRGDSMDNGLRGSFADGDILTGRRLYQKHWRNKLHIHQYKYFILVTADGIQIKEITEHRVEEGIIVCHSLNPDKDKYPDFEMSLADVREIYYVKARTEPLD